MNVELSSKICNQWFKLHPKVFSPFYKDNNWYWSFYFAWSKRKIAELKKGDPKRKWPIFLLEVVGFYPCLTVQNLCASLWFFATWAWAVKPGLMRLSKIKIQMGQFWLFFLQFVLAQVHAKSKAFGLKQFFDLNQWFLHPKFLNFNNSWVSNLTISPRVLILAAFRQL